MDREAVVPTIFSSQSKRRASLETKNLQKILEQGFTEQCKFLVGCKII